MTLVVNICALSICLRIVRIIRKQDDAIHSINAHPFISFRIFILSNFISMTMKCELNISILFISQPPRMQLHHVHVNARGYGDIVKQANTKRIHVVVNIATVLNIKC